MIEPTHFESLYPPNTRENEITKIISFIKEGSSCQIIGLSGGGRSNLLGLLTYNRNVRIKHLGENEKWFHFVLSNFAEVRKKSLFDVTKFLFLNLVDSLRERDMQEEHQKALAIFKESLNLNDELVLFQGLKRVIDLLAIEKELTVVFLFDRFEDYIPTVTPEFFTNLRVLRDRAKYRFSVVFSLHKPLEDLIGQDLLLDFYQFVAGHIVYLSLSDKIGVDFRISYIQKASGKTLDKKLIDAIISQTAGQPNLTRLAVEAALERDSINVILNSGGVMLNSFRHLNTLKNKTLKQVQGDNNKRVQHDKERSLSKFLLEQKPIKAALLDIWKSLSPEEQSLLVHSSEFIVQSSNSYLENVGLLKNGKITIPLFAQFLKQFNKQSSNITFDLNTLSDSLTSSEHKLITFLMHNSGKIIEREEIINAVWTDNKSSAGVTDQALDQLIFRLRKKIEDDPNNPTHLQTVKGRGFRFTQ